jgi:hypothetical protein
MYSQLSIHSHGKKNPGGGPGYIFFFFKISCSWNAALLSVCCSLTMLTIPIAPLRLHSLLQSLAFFRRHAIVARLPVGFPLATPVPPSSVALPSTKAGEQDLREEQQTEGLPDVYYRPVEQNGHQPVPKGLRHHSKEGDRQQSEDCDFENPPSASHSS